MKILSGDCVSLMSQMEHESVDSIVTDPPYHFTSIVKRFGAEGAAPAKSDGATGVYERSSRGFMGKTWDGGDVAFRPETWAAALRVLKPGGHLVAFGAPKNYHRLACAIEDAGFEIRDSLMWLTGQGFPKSHNVSMKLDDIRCRCEDGTETLSECDMRLVRDADVPAPEHDETQLREVLQYGVPEQGAQGDRPSEAPAADARGREPGLEGRGDLQEASRQLRERPLRSVPAGVPIDGEGGRVCDGTPSGDGAVGGEAPDAGGVRPPQEPPPAGKRPSKSRTVAGQPEPQVSGTWPLCGRCGKPTVPDGLGTALKPAYEPIILARKPLIGTVAENVLALGTGALNIDACRVAGGDENPSIARRKGAINHLSDRPARETEAEGKMVSRQSPEAFRAERAGEALGRWPANLVHDGSEEVLAGFPNAPGQQRRVGPDHGAKASVNTYGDFGPRENFEPRGDSGSAARFFASFPQEDQTWLDLSLLPGSASTAENSSLLPNETVASALVRAVNSALPEGLLCDPASTVLSTSATASGLKALVETATGAILSIGPRFWRASPPAKLSLTVDRASVAVVREPTGTTTITVSHWRSDGSADPVTFSITPLNSGLGAKDSARFLYHPKASAKDRAGSKHPTVKPIALMRWLVRLITPPGGTVLDPFAGSGTTGQAAMEEGFDAVLIEREAEYLADIRRRLGVMPSLEDMLS